MLISPMRKFRLLALDTGFARTDLSRFGDDSRLLKRADSTVAKTIVPQDCVGSGWIDWDVLQRLR